MYIYNLDQIQIFPYDRADSASTIDVLKYFRVEKPEVEIKLAWDGISYRRSQIVKEAAKVLDINLEPLPAYSPNFMPVEWLRENVTYHTCCEHKAELIDNVKWFDSQINNIPLPIAHSLWVKTYFNLEEEKLQFST